ncbi:choice-of-anchor J family PEP-CTERM protein [Massilia sp. ST3]|uniref:choice-of-anchor J family PEP-CTERM protein n=1 Tax=Massilia sp. ST3 TaxID=2824903 RepID=UPI001B8282AD|nr:choice-of-anchor J domain-containing protein [Massilia sp. ST3]MBQ5949520.1 PEP-CTERM sorting domain-containing protein [Massilia sp. ST3]
MNRLSYHFAAAALAMAACLPHGGHAAPIQVLSEGFDNLAGLSDWVLVNRSLPPGTGWFQGNPDVFIAESGADDAYAAANFLGAANGIGLVDNWLVTPVLNLSGWTRLSFFTNRAGAPGFDDRIEVRFAAGSGTGPEAFGALLASIGGDGFPAQWQQWNRSIAAEGPGRFAFRYRGDTADLDYVGLDTVSVVTGVPEPASWLLIAGGAGLLAFGRRRPVR